MMSRVSEMSLQLVLAIRVLERMALAFPIIALTPTFSPAFKSRFFSRTVTIPSKTI